MFSLLFKSDQIKHLEKIIAGAPRVSLTKEKRQKIKTQLMESIKLVKAVKKVSLQTLPSANFRAFLKEKLLTLIEFEGRRKFFVWPKLTPMKRRFLGAVLTLLFFVTALFNFTFTPQKAEASAATVLEEMQGSVIIVRDSQAMSVKPGFLLKTDDTIKTGKDSQAIIRFLDQSVSRLSENTEIAISKLYINPINKTETIIEIALRRGRLYARVINLINDFSRFQVQAGDTLAVAKKKAAFDIEVQSKKRSKVSAIQNRVDLVIETDKRTVETTVVKGFSAEVKTVASLPQIVHNKTESEKDTNWIASNLEKDKVYIETVKKESEQQRREQVKNLPEAVTPLLSATDELDKKKAYFADAQKKFSDAELLLAKGHNDKALELLSNFYLQIEEIFKWLKEYEMSHPAEASAFRTQIIESLNNSQKQLALILPTEPLHLLKETVAKVQLAFVSADQAQKTQQQFSYAEDKLIEAHDLAEMGDVDAAKEQVAAYTQAISDVVSEMKQLPKQDMKQAVNTLLENSVDNLKTLSTITPPMEESVSLAKTEALTKIGKVVVEAQKLNQGEEMKQKIEELQNIDVNGKPVINVSFNKDKVTLKSDTVEVSVERKTDEGLRFSPPSATDLGTSVSPLAQP
ncbi:FecR domain-containing protein [Candidatus Peregrinibacteria bacterium]|nr:FecR domain-containing protein [Candidatus Peregrinibacteria bacterium]